ncbi:MAG: AraC family transcriptional regulator [Cyanobacteria bacterium P01_G01_bin.54]
MAFRITDNALVNLAKQAEQQGEEISHHNTLGAQNRVPQQLGEGYEQYICFHQGLTIHIFQGQFWQPIIRERQHEATFPITARFYLSGGLRIQTDNVPEIAADYEEMAGCNYLYHLPDLVELEAYPAHTPIQTMMVYADADYFQALNPTDEVESHPLQRLLQAEKRFHRPLGKTTPAMNQVLQQILHCPHQGTTQQLYLESKALELLALQFADLEADASAPHKHPLNAADLERVQYARDILVHRLCDPPSLIELAHLCELNDFKLKQGFRQLFGTTVFGYLYDYRMKQAQELLRGDQLSVAVVSAQVGYGSPAAFSTAFRRKFAVSPKAYQLGQRGKP